MIYLTEGLCQFGFVCELFRLQSCQAEGPS